MKKNKNNWMINFDTSTIKTFDDIPFHGIPNQNNPGFPKGLRGNEKAYFNYCKKNKVDTSKLTKQEVEQIIKKLALV